MSEKAKSEMPNAEEVLTAGKKQCPACGKYVDKERRVCPECTAQFSYRLKEFTLVKFSLIFVVLGVVYFLIAANWQAPVTKIDELDKDDNFSIMRFEGKVVRTPRYYPSKYDDYGEMKFYVNDTTGEIQVLCGSKVTEELIGSGNIPAIGDTVEVLGRVLYIGGGTEFDESMTISEDGINVYLDKTVVQEKTMPFMRVEVMYEDNIKISDRSYSVKDISDVAGKPGDTYESGKKVMISGTLVSEITNYTTNYQMTIGDLGSGDKLLVYVPKDLLELSEIELYSKDDLVYNLKPGSEVTIFGALEYYESSYGPQYSKWELIPTTLNEKSKVQGKSCFQVTAEGEGFTVDMLMSNKYMFKGEQVYLQGVKVSKNDPKLYVKDSGGQEELLIFSYDTLEDFDLGDTVELSGEFTQYQDTWEIKISGPSDIREVV